MRIIPLLLFALWLALWPGCLWAQDAGKQITPGPPGLRASLSAESADLGSLVALSLEYRLPEGGKLSEPPEIKGLEGLTVVERVAEPGRIKLTLLVDRIDTWETGAFSLGYLDDKGEAQTLTAPPLSLKVLSNLGERPADAELRPIAGIIPITAWWSRILPWAGALAAIMMLGLGAYWWLRRRRVTSDFREPEAPPHVRAGREIEGLLKEGLFEKGPKTFYFRFSEILRRYLESLRGFPAAELTTEEISARIRLEEDRVLVALLRQADLVKFADLVPAQARVEEEVRSALDYIQKTAPILEAEYVIVKSEDGARGV